MCAGCLPWRDAPSPPHTLVPLQPVFARHLLQSTTAPRPYCVAPTGQTAPSNCSTTDWRTKGVSYSAVGNILNQGYCASCWAFTTASVIETSIAIK